MLEGSLELELNKSKFGPIKKSFIGALLPIIALAVLLALAFRQFGDFSFKDGLINAIPLCVISSAIAIPSVRNLAKHNKEFVIYEVSKIYHLPGLIFILLFGLSIGNLDELKRFKWIERFKPDELNKEVIQFKELTIEVAFLVRALFFLLFGYLIEMTEVLNADTFLWAIRIVFFIFFFRTIQLKLSRLPLQPLLFVAPRGLITILLFLSIAPANKISLVNRPLIIQVIILTALVMMIGLIINKRQKEELQP
ncbi:MAG: hypothetical protein KF852_06405 [Saprospiraceae bacterium]|nr:hypothetical protein [Saprospiraceae bacterium]